MLHNIWDQLPYVFGCIFWWILLPIAMIVWPWVGLSISRRSHKYSEMTEIDYTLCSIAIVITIVVIFVYIAAIVAYEKDHRYDGHHEWRGGAGPNTVCYYENHNELVGVIGKGGHYEDHTYTVCIDSIAG